MVKAIKAVNSNISLQSTIHVPILLDSVVFIITHNSKEKQQVNCAWEGTCIGKNGTKLHTTPQTGNKIQGLEGRSQCSMNTN